MNLKRLSLLSGAPLAAVALLTFVTSPAYADGKSTPTTLSPR